MQNQMLHKISKLSWRSHYVRAVFSGLFLAFVVVCGTGCAMVEPVRLSQFSDALTFHDATEQRLARHVLAAVHEVERAYSTTKRGVEKGNDASLCLQQSLKTLKGLKLLALQAMHGFEKGSRERHRALMMHHFKQSQLVHRQTLSIKMDTSLCYGTRYKSYQGVTKVSGSNPFCKEKKTKKIIKEIDREHPDLLNKMVRTNP